MPRQPILRLLLGGGLCAATAALRPALDAMPSSLRGRLDAYAHPALAFDAASPLLPPASGGIRCSPLNFGGDPTGRADSAGSLNQCVAWCVNYSKTVDFLGHFPGDASFGNGKYIANAGGCEIDLGGGEFLLSRPVIIPEFVGNLRLGHGSLVADATPGVFPPTSFLVIVGIPGSCQVPQGSCNVDLGFPELFLDGSHVASGIQINNVMGTTVGPGAYFLNFTLYGLQINAGHEVMVDRSWLGETNFDYPFSKTDLPTSIAIQINGNDHYVLNTVVFSSKIGLEVNGAANYITGVHVWFPDNQALAFVDEGVMAFHITEGQNRFMGCYIDGSRAVFERGGLAGNIWTHGFECCAGVDAPHGIELLGTTIGPGLTIADNLFRGGYIYSPTATTPLLVLAQCTPGAPQQQFVVSAAGAVTHVSSGACVQAPSGVGGQLSLTACREGASNQHWAVVAGGSGSVVTNGQSGNACASFNNDNGVIDVGNPVITYACGEPPAWNEIWRSITVGTVGAIEALDESGAASGRCLDIAAPSTPVVTGTRIEGNSFTGSGSGSRATLTLSQNASTQWHFNFCDRLVFPTIARVSLSVVAAEGFPIAVARVPVNCSVLVETNIPMTGSITATADSSGLSSDFV